MGSIIILNHIISYTFSNIRPQAYQYIYSEINQPYPFLNKEIIQLNKQILMIIMAIIIVYIMIKMLNYIFKFLKYSTKDLTSAVTIVIPIIYGKECYSLFMELPLFLLKIADYIIAFIIFIIIFKIIRFKLLNKRNIHNKIKKISLLIWPLLSKEWNYRNNGNLAFRRILKFDDKLVNLYVEQSLLHRLEIRRQVLKIKTNNYILNIVNNNIIPRIKKLIILSLIRYNNNLYIDNNILDLLIIHRETILSINSWCRLINDVNKILFNRCNGYYIRWDSPISMKFRMNNLQNGKILYRSLRKLQISKIDINYNKDKVYQIPIFLYDKNGNINPINNAFCRLYYESKVIYNDNINIISIYVVLYRKDIIKRITLK